jgi:two-component system cell cycle sensor histidine kinase/response regulator CckA
VYDQPVDERVKQLTALHRAAGLLLEAQGSESTLLRQLIALLPPAMQFPERATASLRYGGAEVATPGHTLTPCTMAETFQTADGQRGEVVVAYRDPPPSLESGAPAFLPEEVALLASITDMVRVALDRRHAETAILVANDRLNLALSTAGMGVWEWDLVTGAVHWSEQMSRMVGIDHELNGKFFDFAGYVHPEDRSHLEQRLRRAAGGDELRGVELRLRRPDGTWRPMTANMRILRDRGGQPVRVVAALLDLTERRALEESLRQTQRIEALGQVASGVAHDFNNLLTVLLTGTHVLLDDLPADHPHREIVEDMRIASESGSALTDQLLAFARQGTFRPAAVALNPTVMRLEPLLARITRSRIKLRVELDPRAGSVWADPAQIEQVIMNLVVNARDASPDGGVVTVSTGVTDSYAVIAVRDTGPGIPPELQARIFEPFFTTKETGKGTGLGLAVVAGVARQWEGQVRVESAPGIGATFRVLLPQLAA